MTADTQFEFQFQNFYKGNAPLAYLDNETFLGDEGQASDMKADIVSNPGFLQQSPGLADLTNGNDSGVVDQLIRFILDKPTATDTTFGVGTTKLFKLSSTAVSSGGSPSWPQTITDMTEGESIVRLGDDLLIFYNKSSGGDIASMDLSTETIDPDWGTTTDQALEKAPHPSAVKEDICVFGNGRYAGTLILGTNTLDVQKLDFGEGSEVVDVVFHSNVWWIAVNYGYGRRGQIYVYDGSAMSNILSDEAGLGSQQIGFLHVHNGLLFIAYEDKTSPGYAIGFLNGRSIKPLRYFSGSLPTHRQKTIYNNTLIFASGESILSTGAAVDQLPIQISALMDGGFETIGAVAAPFGIPMIASGEDTDFRLAQMSGYSTDSYWKSVLIDTTKERSLGRAGYVIVSTKPLEEGASCVIRIEGNQGNEDFTSRDMEISGTGKTRFVFTAIGQPSVEDMRIVVDYSEGSTTKTVPIRKISVGGNFVER